MNIKAMLKAVVPFVGTLVAVGVQVLVTGEFDKAEVATAVTGILASIVTYIVPNDNNADRITDTTPVK